MNINLGLFGMAFSTNVKKTIHTYYIVLNIFMNILHPQE